MNDAFTDALRAAASAEEVTRIVTGQVQPELLEAATEQVAGSPAAGSPAEEGKASASQEASARQAAAPEAEAPAHTPAGEEPAGGGGSAPSGKKVIVGVTSCPTGIAHTFMAAEALERAGHERGITVAVEGQGSGKIDILDPELVKRASAVIFAHSLPVKGIERFAGKPVVDVDVKAPSTTPERWSTRPWPPPETRTPSESRPTRATRRRRTRRRTSTGLAGSSRP